MERGVGVTEEGLTWVEGGGWVEGRDTESGRCLCHRQANVEKTQRG